MKRYYCPGCGQVAGTIDDARYIAVVRGGRVAPHFLASALSALLGEGQRRSLSLCPGGTIDKERDRAP